MSSDGDVRRIVLLRFDWPEGDRGRVPAMLAACIRTAGLDPADLVLHRPLAGGQACGYLHPAPDRRTVPDAAFGELRSALAARAPGASAVRLAALVEREGASVAQPATHHYVVETDVLPAAEGDFNAWYDEEHLPGLAAVPGTVRAARYRNLDGGPRYHACYALAALAVFGSPPWLAVRATAWSSRVRPSFVNTRRTMYRSVAVPPLRAATARA